MSNASRPVFPARPLHHTVTIPTRWGSRSKVCRASTIGGAQATGCALRPRTVYAADLRCRRSDWAAIERGHSCLATWRASICIRVVNFSEPPVLYGLAEGECRYDDRQRLLFSRNLVLVTPKSSPDGHDGVLAGPWRNSFDSWHCGVAGEFQLRDWREVRPAKRRAGCHGYCQSK